MQDVGEPIPSCSFKCPSQSAASLRRNLLRICSTFLFCRNVTELAIHHS